ncbi:MAG: hypothetical protein HC888_00235 [Candidatus Competibacteraceae bacterium]|nr:hypothetical protein [Candidatus Competibacteraceae bacterium]
MKITARMVNTKRHTQKWKIGGTWRTRAEAVRLARQGRVEGVTVRRGGNDELHIAALPNSGVRLYDLPTRVA